MSLAVLYKTLFNIFRINDDQNDNFYVWTCIPFVSSAMLALMYINLAIWHSIAYLWDGQMLIITMFLYMITNRVSFPVRGQALIRLYWWQQLEYWVQAMLVASSAVPILNMLTNYFIIQLMVMIEDNIL